MRAIGVVVAVLLVLLGAVWLGQGLGFIRGSFMTGQAMWAWIGALLIVVGAGLGLLSARRSRTG
jgi:hypothetical protein